MGRPAGRALESEASYRSLTARCTRGRRSGEKEATSVKATKARDCPTTGAAACVGLMEALGREWVTPLGHSKLQSYIMNANAGLLRSNAVSTSTQIRNNISEELQSLRWVITGRVLTTSDRS